MRKALRRESTRRRRRVLSTDDPCGRSGFAFLVACSYYGLDVPADIEIAFELERDRVAGLDKIIANEIYDVFVEDLDLTK